MSAADPWEVPRLRLASIGEAVRRARKHAGHSLRDIGDHVDGLDAPYLVRIEHGTAVPPPAVAAALSRYVLQHGETGALGPFGPRHHPTPATPTPARSTDPDTSDAAAASVDEWRARATHWALIELLTYWDHLAAAACTEPTHENIAIGYESVRTSSERPFPQASPSGLRTRLAELVRAGWVRDTGDRATMSTGRRAIVWGLTDLGRYEWDHRDD